MEASLKDKFNPSAAFKYDGPFVIERFLTPTSFVVLRENNVNEKILVHIDQAKIRERRDVDY